MDAIELAIEELAWALRHLDEMRTDDAYDKVMIELREIGRLADSMMPET